MTLVYHFVTNISRICVVIIYLSLTTHLYRLLVALCVLWDAETIAVQNISNVCPSSRNGSKDLYTAVLFDSSWSRDSVGTRAVSINATIKPLQRAGAERHYHGAEGKEADSSFSGKLLEDRIRVPVYVSISDPSISTHYTGTRVPSVVCIASLDPKPIAEGNRTRQTESRDDCDGPGR